MGLAKQLYQLQELDLDIAAREQALSQKAGQLGDRHALTAAEEKLAASQGKLEELRHQQRSAEQDIDDLSDKIKTAEGQLYDGKTTSPKELSNLQHEVNTFKAKRDELETQALEIMEQSDTAAAAVSAASDELKKMETGWQTQQQQLAVAIEQLQGQLAELNKQRQAMTGGLDPQALASYEKIRKEKGQAMARVEQGICRNCRISLSYSELQQAKNDQLVQCGNCGRILFLP